MIIEIAIGAGLLMAGAAVARAIFKKQQKDATPPTPHVKMTPVTSGPRGLVVGDVLLYTDAELWLAGMIELDEEGFVMRLFAAPGGGRAAWVAQLDPEAKEIALLHPTKDVPEGLVPHSLPIGGYRLTLHKRGQATITSSGEHLPARIPNRARYTWLEGAGGRIALIIDLEQPGVAAKRPGTHGSEIKADRIALTGERLGRELFDLLPGGDRKPDAS
jgi:hypothetical protein